MKLAASLLAATLAFPAGALAQDIQIAGPAPLAKDGTLEISGNGFPADAPITLLFATADGVVADIGYALDPQPVANAEGTWSTTWDYGRFVAKGLVEAGDYALTATDAALNDLATATVTFEAVE